MGGNDGNERRVAEGVGVIVILGGNIDGANWDDIEWLRCTDEKVKDCTTNGICVDCETLGNTDGAFATVDFTVGATVEAFVGWYVGGNDGNETRDAEGVGAMDDGTLVISVGVETDAGEAVGFLVGYLWFPKA